MTSTDSPASAPGGVAALARDTGTGSTATTADAAEIFLGLLTQATAAPAAAATVTPACVAVAAQTDTDDTDAERAPVDWVTPFLPLPPGLAPAPLDFELPATGAGGEMAPAGIALNDGDGTVVPLPVLLDDARASKDPGALGAPDPVRSVDASGSAAISGAPRVEAAGSGAAQAVVRHVSIPVSDGRWPEHVGHEVRILVERGVQAATLRLTPEHLGPVDVRIDIVNDKANVVFGAAHADTRAALTEAIPKLREMFAGAGLTLGDAGVRQDHPGRFSGSGPRHSSIDAVGHGDAGEAVVSSHAVRLGLVDAYA